MIYGKEEAITDNESMSCLNCRNRLDGMGFVADYCRIDDRVIISSCTSTCNRLEVLNENYIKDTN